MPVERHEVDLDLLRLHVKVETLHQVLEDFLSPRVGEVDVEENLETIEQRTASVEVAKPVGQAAGIRI